MPVARFDLGTPLRHVVGAASLLAIIAGSAMVIVWAFAHTLARNSDTIQASEFAATLSPSDPRTRFAFANDLERTFDLDAIDRSLVEYEEAVALTPYNFLYWLALGQARERAGERPSAETAYRRALELAPNYGVAKWSLGNNLLRQGKVEEGIDLIRGAVEKDPSLAAPAVIAAMQVFDGDVGQVNAALGSSPLAAAELSKYLANEGRFDEAISVWDRLPAEVKLTTAREVGSAIRQKLIEAKRYRNALAVTASLESDETRRPAVGAISNGRFEHGVAVQNVGPFDWNVGNSYPVYGLAEGQSREGRYSLLVRFPTDTRSGFETVNQTVAVEPGVAYELILSFRSDLKTRAEFRWEVVSAKGGERLAASDPLANTLDWQQIRVPFASPDDADGVTIRLTRENCDSAACAVSGNLWFDDIRLVRK